MLDPFCGCGTTLDAAQGLDRQWIGIDITYIAIDLMRRRLEDTYGSSASFEIDGIPSDVQGAQALFRKNAFDFERWAVSMVYGQPNAKQVGDRGIDGVVRFPLPGKGKFGRMLVSVKGGQQIGPSAVRDLAGTLKREKAEMGVMIIMRKPTRGITDEANHSGSYIWPVDNRSYPRIQIVTVEQLLAGHRLDSPPALTPYVKAARAVAPSQQLPFPQKDSA